MSNNPETVVRIFDGVDSNSSLLIGKDAHQALLGVELSTVLHRLGYETRKVANSQAVSEAELATNYGDFTAIHFPEKTTVLGKFGTTHTNVYQAKIGLEIRPPLDTEAINKIAPFIGRLLQDKKSDFVILDDRGKKNAKKIYSKPFTAQIIPLPIN